MDFMSKFTISASMLLTGFVIVFSVLVFLIFIIWVMGKIVTKAQEKAAARKVAKLQEEKKLNETSKKQTTQPKSPAPAPKPAVQAGTSDEIVAVISAAVYSMYGSKEKVKIKSIKKSSSRSAWANAGVLNNTRPF